MRKFIALAVLLITSITTAQIQDPTAWITSVEKIDDTHYKLITDVSIDTGWHVYSQAKLERDEGPLPTEFQFFNSAGNYKLVGINKEETPYAEFTAVWDQHVYQFSDTARFTQEIELLNSDLNYIACEVYFMVCDEEQCLPPAGSNLLFKIDPQVIVNVDDIVNAIYDAGESGVIASAPLSSTIKKKAELEKENSLSDEDDNKGLWTIFFIAFLSGFAALLTPCVFPMIPLTVSFFTKQSKNRAVGISNAIIYGIAIIAIYVTLGTVVTAIFGAESLSELSTSVIFNIAFFVILVFFAVSFLGAFEITLPQSWANSADRKADKGGIIGIFFMALALAIVSFSCTGPIVGSLIVEAASKGGLAPVIGMLGFSLAIALPFTLFAIFPSWLNSLPKSGGWLNTVKVFLGFLELALAFKFLSNADLVMQWGVFTREIFLAIWIAIFGAMSLYLFGKIKLPHDGPDQSISVGRLLLGLVFMAFTFYLVPGLWGAPLKAISGFAPPLFYSESPYGVGYTKASAMISNGEIQELPDGAHLAVYDIIAFEDYDKGVAYAQEVDKPILLDFTGWACVNCRRMEERVWVEPEILKMMKNDYVVISLYVDEKTELPQDEQYVSKTTGKRIRNIGNKWADLQVTNYAVNAQPFYVILDKNGKDKKNIKPVGYTPDALEFEEWLKSGLK